MTDLLERLQKRFDMMLRLFVEKRNRVEGHEKGRTGRIESEPSCDLPSIDGRDLQYPIETRRP